jgi:hypothetical protein
LTGEDSDLDPDSDTSYDGGPLLTWVANEGQRQIAAWKDRTGRQLLIPELYSEMYFKSHVITGTLDSDGTASTITLPSADVGGDDDRYNGWLVEVGSETKMVVDYNGTTYTATVHEDWDTTPASGDSYTLMKRWNLVVPSTGLWASENISEPSGGTTEHRSEGKYVTILKITDLVDEVELEMGGRTEDYSANLLTTGTPTGWIMKGNRVIFNYAPDEERWYKADYFRMPYEMSDDDHRPEIPEMFHYGIVLWGRWWVYERDQEKGAAYTAKKDFEDFMSTTKSTWDVKLHRVDTYGVLQRS